MTTKLVVDCSTGLVEEIPLTEEELAQREADRIAFEKAEEARKAEEAEKAAKKAEAKAKKAAAKEGGQHLTNTPLNWLSTNSHLARTLPSKLHGMSQNNQ